MKNFKQTSQNRVLHRHSNTKGGGNVKRCFSIASKNFLSQPLCDSSSDQNLKKCNWKKNNMASFSQSLFLYPVLQFDVLLQPHSDSTGHSVKRHTSLPHEVGGRWTQNVSPLSLHSFHMAQRFLLSLQQLCFIFIIFRARGSLANFFIPLVGQGLHLDSAM